MSRYQTRLYRVNIRRGPDWPDIRKGAEQLDGQIFMFQEGWIIADDPEEPQHYIGEIAMIPRDSQWPKDAPTWIASGDLDSIKT